VDVRRTMIVRVNPNLKAKQSKNSWHRGIYVNTILSPWVSLALIQLWEGLDIADSRGLSASSEKPKERRANRDLHDICHSHSLTIGTTAHSPYDRSWLTCLEEPGAQE